MQLIVECSSAPIETPIQVDLLDAELPRDLGCACVDEGHQLVDDARREVGRDLFPVRSPEPEVPQEPLLFGRWRQPEPRLSQQNHARGAAARRRDEAAQVLGEGLEQRRRFGRLVDVVRGSRAHLADSA
jgi:hypothetical protein